MVSGSDGSTVSRVAGLAGPVLLLLLLLGGGFVGVVRYTEWLDPPAPGLTHASMAALHQPPGTCLRYPVAPPRASVDSAAEALLRAGLSASELGGLVGDLYARAASQELPLHAKAEVDEYLDVMSANLSLPGRMVLALKRDRLRAQLSHALFRSVPISGTVATLKPEQRAALDAQWSRDASVFMLPGLLELVNVLKVAATNRKMDEVQAALVAQLSAGEPPSLARLTDTNDEWGSALTLERTDDGALTLSSLGRDGVAGGSGFDADLQRTLDAKTIQAVEPTVPAVACAGSSNVTLQRSQVDAALEDLDSLSSAARVVPAFEGGVASGFRLSRVRPDSLFARAGLCDGDVVRAVNGIAMGTPDRALEAYATLRGTSRFELSLTRAGAPFTLVVQVR